MTKEDKFRWNFLFGAREDRTAVLTREDVVGIVTGRSCEGPQKARRSSRGICRPSGRSGSCRECRFLNEFKTLIKNEKLLRGSTSLRLINESLNGTRKARLQSTTTRRAEPRSGS